jgi:RHS repeat-associated protein
MVFIVGNTPAEAIKIQMLDPKPGSTEIGHVKQSWPCKATVVHHPEYEHLIEWSAAGGNPSIGIGPRFAPGFPSVGMHQISVGQDLRQQANFQIYAVRQITHTSERGQIVWFDFPITFRATTDPPGYEKYVPWSVDTMGDMHTHADPVSGTGPAFTTTFKATTSPGSFWALIEGGNLEALPSPDILASPITPPPPPPNDPIAQGSVYLHSGDFFQTAHDLVVPGRGFDFDFTRVYRSQLGLTTVLGANWDFQYNRRLIQVNASTLSLVYGLREASSLTGGGLRPSDPYLFNALSGKYLPPAGNYDFIAHNADATFSLKRPGGMEWVFFDFSVANPGKLKAIKDRNGNQMLFAYTAGLLTQITDTLNRVYTLGYTGSLLTSLSDFSGRTVTFTHDGNGDLRTVTSPPTPDSPTGRVTRYTYSSGFADSSLNHNLLTITDPKNQTYLTNVYDNDPSHIYSYDRVTSQTYGSGTFTFDYLGSSATLVTDRNGNIVDWIYNSDGTPVQKIVFTNRVVNPNDPPSFTTTYTHNVDGERATTTLPRGNSTTATYDSANPDIRRHGNLLSLARADGPLGGSADLVLSATYEPNFQFMKTLTDPRGNITTYFFDYEEATLGDLNGDGNINQANGNIVRIQMPAVTQGLSAPQAAVIRITYNSFGQVLQYKHPENNTDVYTYFSSGASNGYLQSLVRDSGGQNIPTTFTYNLVGSVTSVTDGKGALTSYTLNAVNQITQKVERPPLNLITDYTYDPNGNLVTIDVDNKDENGNFYANSRLTTTFTHDILNHPLTLTREVDAAKNLTSSYQYDANENTTRIIEPLGNKVRTIYDERNLAYQEIRGEGSPDASTQTRTYDENTNLIQVIDGRNKIWTFLFDGFDRQIQSITPKGFATTYGYDANSNLISERHDGQLNHVGGSNVRLAEASYQHDELNRLFQTDQFYFDPATQTPFPDGPASPGDGKATTRYRYDQNDRRVLVRDDLNRDTALQYDGVDRITNETDSWGNTITTVFDPNDNVMSVTEHEFPEGGGAAVDMEFPERGGTAVDTVTTSIYDGLDRQVSRTIQSGDPLAETTTYGFDSRNNLVHAVDAKGNTYSMIFDGINRQTQRSIDLRTGGVGSGGVFHTITMTQVWDDDSRLFSQTDDNLHATTYGYDALNRKKLTTYADGTTASQTFDGNDNTLTSTDQNGSMVTNTYDDDGRLASRSIARAAGVIGVAAETYGYDGLNRPTLAQDEDSAVITTYDSLGQARSEAQNGAVLARNINSAGQVLNITYPGGRSIDQTLDVLNRTQTITNAGGSQILNNDYVGLNGRFTQRSFGNGTRSSLTYDTIRRPSEILDQKLSPSTTITDFQYGFDKMNDRLYERKVHAPWNGQGDVFLYDSAMRVSTAKLGVQDPIAESNNPGTGGIIQKTVNYSLDGVGNRTSVTENGTPTNYTMNAASPPADYQMNQYTTVGGSSLTYDANGNLKTDGTFQYFYDYRNQLSQVKNAAGTLVVADYSFDPYNRRIQKSVGGVMTKFLFDGDQTVEERDASNTVQATYVWGTCASCPNSLVSFRRSGQDYYVHRNSLETPSAVSDASGNVVERYDYDSFGAVTIRNGAGTIISSSAIGNPYLYTGQRFDPETGFYDYHRRMYSPTPGRFLQRDPIGVWTDPNNLGNGFTYVQNDPVNLTDPMGLFPLAPSGCNQAFEVQGTETMWWQFSTKEACDEARFVFDHGDIGQMPWDEPDSYKLIGRARTEADKIASNMCSTMVQCPYAYFLRGESRWYGDKFKGQPVAWARKSGVECVQVSSPPFLPRWSKKTRSNYLYECRCNRDTRMDPIPIDRLLIPFKLATAVALPYTNIPRAAQILLGLSGVLFGAP